MQTAALRKRLIVPSNARQDSNKDFLSIVCQEQLVMSTFMAISNAAVYENELGFRSPTIIP